MIQLEKTVLLLEEVILLVYQLVYLMARNSYPGNSTVTILHSRSKNIDEICKKADILIVALGKANFVTSDMIKEGACILMLVLQEFHQIRQNLDGNYLEMLILKMLKTKLAI